MTFEKKKSRLRGLFVLAAALGCSSASLSGVLASLAAQPVGIVAAAGSAAVAV